MVEKNWYPKKYLENDLVAIRNIAIPKQTVKIDS